MTEEQPTTEHNAAEQQDKLREQWDSSELPAHTPVTVSAEHTTQDAPEVAAFHLGGKDSLEDRQKKGALYQVVDTSKLKRLGNYYQYEGYFFDASQGGDYLVVSSPNDGGETRRGNADAQPENFHYMFVGKGGQLEIGRDQTSEITPDVNNGEYTSFIKLDVDDEGNISFIDLDSTNGTTLHTPENATVVEGSLLTPETTEDTDNETEADEQVEYEARDLLSHSQRLHTTIDEASTKFMRNTGLMVAHTRNGISMPKNTILRMRRDRAQRKYDRKAAKQGTSMFKFVNRHRDKVASRAKVKLDKKETAYTSHSKKMDDRITRVETTASRRAESTETYIKQTAEAKIVAVERKLQRRERRERTLQLKHMERGPRKLSHEERHNLINTFSDDDNKRIRTAAVRAVQGKYAKLPPAERLVVPVTENVDTRQPVPLEVPVVPTSRPETPIEASQPGPEQPAETPQPTPEQPQPNTAESLGVMTEQQREAMIGEVAQVAEHNSRIYTYLPDRETILSKDGDYTVPGGWSNFGDSLAKNNNWVPQLHNDSTEVFRFTPADETNSTVINPLTGQSEPAVTVAYQFNTFTSGYTGPTYMAGHRPGNALFVEATIPQSVANKLQANITDNPQLAREFAQTIVSQNGVSESLWNTYMHPPYHQLPDSWNMTIIDQQDKNTPVAHAVPITK